MFPPMYVEPNEKILSLLQLGIDKYKTIRALSKILKIGSLVATTKAISKITATAGEIAFLLASLHDNYLFFTINLAISIKA